MPPRAPAERGALCVRVKRIVSVDRHPQGVGDRLLVAQGEVVPVDGFLVSEAAVLDASALTGETRPVEAQRGDAIQSGALNAAAPLEMVATATAEASTYAAIVRLVREASAVSLSAFSIVVVIPAPEAAVASVVIGHGEQVIGQRVLTQIDAQPVSNDVRLSGSLLHWQNNGLPATVRYTADGGATWEVLAVDTLKTSLMVDLTSLTPGGYFEITLADSSLPLIYQVHAGAR